MTTADNQPLGQALAENQAFLQTMFGGSSDFYTKSFTICGCRCCIAMFAGLSSPEKLCIMVLHALGQGVPGCKAGPQLVQYLAEQSCLPTEQNPITTRTQLVEALAGGMAVLLVEGSGQALAFSTQDMPGRSVTKPSGEGNMRGPQDSGLIVGKKEWIDRCRRWGPPTDGVCRGCKTSRESIVGLYKAVQLYLQRDEATLMRTLNRRCAAFERTLRDCGFIQITRTQEGPVGQVMARTYAVMPYGSAKDLADKMRANGIYIGAEPGDRILLNPLMVTPAQVKTVCETLTTCMQQIKEEL